MGHEIRGLRPIGHYWRFPFLAFELSEVCRKPCKLLCSLRKLVKRPFYTETGPYRLQKIFKVVNFESNRKASRFDVQGFALWGSEKRCWYSAKRTPGSSVNCPLGKDATKSKRSTSVRGQPPPQVSLESTLRHLRCRTSYYKYIIKKVTVAKPA